MFGKKIKKQAEELRRLGRSYAEIREAIGVPKSTLCDWFANESWSKQIVKEINRREIEKGIKRVKLMNAARKIEKLNREIRYKEEARQIYVSHRYDPIFVAGMSIYWGEGEKYGNWRLSVVNTDIRMLKTVLRFYEVVFSVPRDRIRIGLFIYSDLNVDEVVKYWSEGLALPMRQFIKPQMLKSKIRPLKKRSQYGICNVYVNSTELKYKIMYLLDEFASGIS